MAETGQLSPVLEAPGLGNNDSGQGKAPRSEFAVGIAAMLGAAFAMSISPTLVRFADVGPLASAFWRVFLALPMLWFWMRQDESRQGAQRGGRYNVATLLAGLTFAGDLTFWHVSILHTTIANATFFATMAPVWVVIFGWLLLRQRVERNVLYGLALCILGGSALVMESMSINPDHAFGDAQAIITGVFFGLYFLAVGAARKRSSAGRVTFELSVVTAVLLLAEALYMEGDILPHSRAGWAVLLALAFISHAGGQGLLSVALGRLPTAFSSLVIFLESVAAAGVAWVFVNEPVSPLQALGGAVIIAGIWIARPRKAKPAV